MGRRAKYTTHGTRNSAAKRARASADTAVPKTGTAILRKRYCTDQRVASSSHLPAS
jgi:hypothetical protein